MFITNNCGSFHFHQKVSKYYENGYLQNFLLLFVSLLTAPIVKNSHIRLKFTLFLKNVENKLESYSIPSSLQVNQHLLAPFCNLVTRILD